MNEFKPWLTDNEHPELCRVLLLAREQQPSAEALERFIDRVRERRPDARPQNAWLPFRGAAPSAADLLTIGLHRITRISTLRRGVGVGAIAIAAAAFAATRFRSPSIDSDAHVNSPAFLIDRNSPEPAGKLAPAPVPLDTAAIQSHDSRESKHASEALPRPDSRAGVPRAKRSPTTLPGSPSTTRLLNTPIQRDSGPAHGTTCYSRERSVVDEARQALGTHRPAAALNVLGEYERQCPFRSFAPEALQIRMRSQAVLGQSRSARETARVLVKRFSGTAPGQEALRFLSQPGSTVF